MKKLLGLIALTFFLSSSANAMLVLGMTSTEHDHGVKEYTILALSTTTSLPTALVLDSGEELTSEELVLRAAEEAASGEIGTNIEVLAEELDVDATDLFLELQAGIE